MDRSRLMLRLASLMAAASLVACGGGGGSDGGEPPPPPAAPPTSGNYAWLLKAQGPTDALKYGLSLVHRSAAQVEWVIEPASAVVTDARTVAAGSVDAANLSSTGLAPYALVYIVGGDVRRVALVADGSEPVSTVQRAQSASACRFVLEAVDHANPERSRFVVSTAGSDGQCDTADDGRAEVKLDATLGVVYTPITGERPLAALRDPTTLAPRGWLGATQAQLWDLAPGTSPVVRDAGTAITRVVASSYRTALVESAGGVALLDFTGGTAFTDTPLSLLAANGWQAIGRDADAFYVYRNTNGTTAATWSVVRIVTGTATAVELATGTGQLSSAAMGTGQLYATVLGAAQNQLLRISKTVPGAITTVDSSVTSTVSTVVASGNGVHQLWRVSGIGSESIQRVLQFVDETGFASYSSIAGGFPVAVMDEDTIDWRRSENRQRFVFVDGYGDQAYAGATLQVFDASTRGVVSLGTLPTATDLGGGFVFANAQGGPARTGAGFAARSSEGVVGDPARVFSFDATAAASLQFTTQQQ